MFELHNGLCNLCPEKSTMICTTHSQSPLSAHLWLYFRLFMSQFTSAALISGDPRLPSQNLRVKGQESGSGKNKKKSLAITCDVKIPGPGRVLAPSRVHSLVKRRLPGAK